MFLARDSNNFFFASTPVCRVITFCDETFLSVALASLSIKDIKRSLWYLNKNIPIKRNKINKILIDIHNFFLYLSLNFATLIIKFYTLHPQTFTA